MGVTVILLAFCHKDRGGTTPTWSRDRLVARHRDRANALEERIPHAEDPRAKSSLAVPQMHQITCLQFCPSHRRICEQQSPSQEHRPISKEGFRDT